MARNSEDITTEEFHRRIRRVFRSFFAENGYPPVIAAGFGDACTFYTSLPGLTWHTAQALGADGYFYPNEIIKATDKELLKARGIGPAGLAQIRRVFRHPFAKDISVVEYVNDLTAEQDNTIPFPLPRRAELMEYLQTQK